MRVQSVSVVVPVFGNADTLVELRLRLRRSLQALSPHPEIIFVNDASPDNSQAILQRLKAEDSLVRLVELDRNLGQQNAIKAGLKLATGDIVVVLDADLQDPPEAIPQLMAHLKNRTFDAVFAARQGIYQSILRMCCSWGFRWLIQALTGLPRGAGSYVVMSQRMAQWLLETRNGRFYLAGLIGCSPYPVSAVPVHRAGRPSGKSAYTGSMRASMACSNILCVLEERFFAWR